MSTKKLNISMKKELIETLVRAKLKINTQSVSQDLKEAYCAINLIDKRVYIVIKNGSIYSYFGRNFWNNGNTWYKTWVITAYIDKYNPDNELFFCTEDMKKLIDVLSPLEQELYL